MIINITSDACRLKVTGSEDFSVVSRVTRALAVTSKMEGGETDAGDNFSVISRIIRALEVLSKIQRNKTDVVSVDCQYVTLSVCYDV